MLNIKFELIPIKIEFLRIFKVAQKLGQSPCTIVQDFDQISPKMARREFFIFIIVSNTYTCSYVEYQV